MTRAYNTFLPIGMMTTKNMVLLVAILMLADMINSQCLQCNRTKKDGRRLIQRIEIHTCDKWYAHTEDKVELKIEDSKGECKTSQLTNGINFNRGSIDVFEDEDFLYDCFEWQMDGNIIVTVSKWGTDDWAFCWAKFFLSMDVHYSCENPHNDKWIGDGNPSTIKMECYDRNSQKEERLNDAAKGGDLATVRELIKTTFVDTTEGSPTLQGLSRGWTPLIQAAYKGHKDIVQILLECGANIDHQANDGWTALMLAARYGHKDVVQILLENGASIDHQSKDGFGNTALMLATKYGYKDIVQILLENGANIDHRDKDGWTALYYATGNGHKDIVQILLDNGANINHQDNDGFTALMWAAFWGKKDEVQLLLDRGANTKLKDKYGDTACTYNDSVDNIIPSCY